MTVRMRPKPNIHASALERTVGAVARFQKLADQLYEEILNQIKVGKLREGSRLPPEMGLAAKFQMSRPVVREALARLRADGIIESRRGSGSYVQRRPSPDFFALAPIGGVADLMRCLEYRIAIEGEAAAIAAERRTAEDLVRIEDAFAELNKAIEHGEVGADADVRFHVAIAKATRNVLFENGLTALSSHVIQGMSLMRRLSLRASQKRVLLVQAEHAEILEAIRNEDPDAARTAMRRHIANARARALSDSVQP